MVQAAAQREPGSRRRIAVVGGGISGLYAAWLLAPKCDVVVFEAEPRLGGHARTVVAGRHRNRSVDTGFIVYNHANYPHLARLFDELDVPVAASDMSFSVSVDDGRIEYGLGSLRALVGQASNLLRPGFWAMIRDILRFHRHAPQVVEHEDLTLGALIRRLRLGCWFADYHLRPMCSAIWSTPRAQIDDYPARSLVRFFRNHGLLSVNGQHRWWTVRGGSAVYVERLAAALRRKGVSLRVGTSVEAVARRQTGIILRVAGGGLESFDDVVLACHADAALRLLADADREERTVLGAFRFQTNRALLHADPRLMPRRRSVWSAWNYLVGRDPDGGASVTYWMNRLQALPEDDPLFVTLNPTVEPLAELVYDETTFRHPVFTHAALEAQERLAALQGLRRTWFVGAWLRHGFHEDGCASAWRVARTLLAAADGGCAHGSRSRELAVS
ncbi:MAG: FAD-dependent oxidoreductase [Verrucomicrobia bacterium]|nr:MAG: FAD-dependent oxidoreductase [Verrucomicrobiota bacterium]